MNIKINKVIKWLLVKMKYFALILHEITENVSQTYMQFHYRFESPLRRYTYTGTHTYIYIIYNDIYH